jgi:hypothetical protein
MNSIVILFIAFAGVFGATLLGVFLRAVLPEQHLSADSKDTVRLGIGVIATMAALVLGLLVTSAKSFYDSQSSELTQLSANVILLDRVLAHYGPETKEARDSLRAATGRTLDLMWHQDQQHSQMEPGAGGGDILYDKIQALSPQNEAQRVLQTQASSMAIDLGKLRWLMIEQESSSVSLPLLALLVLWLAIIFASFGLFAPPNATVISTLFLCALSVSAAIYFIIETYTPFQGLMQISSAPLRNALAHLSPGRN